MSKAKTRAIADSYPFWQQVHREREIRRVNALKLGKTAIYGYWKDDTKVVKPVIESDLNDIPPVDMINNYKLEITYKQANELIKEGAETINLIVRISRTWHLTYKNALKLPNNTFIRDINSRWCLFRNQKFYKIL